MPDYGAAQARAIAAAQALKERQYLEGMRAIQNSEWASDIYNLILNQCPSLPEEDVVRLFSGRQAAEAENVLGAALFHEYNANSRKP